MHVRMCIDQIKCYFLFGYWENVWKSANIQISTNSDRVFQSKKKILKLRLFFREGSKSSVQIREREREGTDFQEMSFEGLKAAARVIEGVVSRKEGTTVHWYWFGSVALAERRRFGGRIRIGKCRGKTGHFWRESSSAGQVRILLYAWKVKNV